MVYVDGAQCTGCGICEDHCPTGAIRLVEGVATVDPTKCTQCEACLKACPHGAVVMVLEPVAEGTSVSSTRPASEMAHVGTRSVPVSSQSKVMPAVGKALAFLGREVAPRLVDYVAGALDRRSDQGQAGSGVDTFRGTGPTSGKGGIGRRRHRRGRRWG